MTGDNFAAAQKRVLKRRRLLEAETRPRPVEQQRASRVSVEALTRFQHSLTGLPGSSSSLWNLIKGREGTRPAFRVGQVDAELLDEELLALLKGQVGEALKYFGPHIREDWSSEIQLALRAILFKLSIWDHNASYGATLQNLRYSDGRSKNPAYSPPTKWQKILYGLFTVGGRYGWEKWESWLIDQESSYGEELRFLSRITNVILAIHSVAAFISFLIFLVNGRYRTLVDRVLRLRLIPPSSHVSREVSFEFLNRQLVWHAFTEFLLFILPIVGIRRWRRWLSKTWRKTVATMKLGKEADKPAERKGQLACLPEHTCAICYHAQNPTAVSENDVLSMAASSGGIVGSAQTDITNAYEAIGCGCIYCFVCITQALEAEEGDGWVCLRCRKLVKQCKPWNGNVVEEVRRVPGPGKNVGFADDSAGDELVEETIVEKAYDASANGGPEDSLNLDVDLDEALQYSHQWSPVERDSINFDTADSDTETVK